VHSLERLSDFVHRLKQIAEKPSAAQESLVQPLLDSTLREFANALADDLNISVALAALFEMVRQINALCDQNKVSQKDAQETLNLLQRFNQVLDVIPLEKKEEEIPGEVEALLVQREEARKAKNWKQSDKWRDEILARGFLIEDTPSGARLKKKR
jgi:cysteinyl-tRNA synthetase